MVAVRYSYPKVNKFIATLQDVDYSIPNTAALNAANFRAQLAFSYLNVQNSNGAENCPKFPSSCRKRLHPAANHGK